MMDSGTVIQTSLALIARRNSHRLSKRAICSDAAIEEAQRFCPRVDGARQ